MRLSTMSSIAARLGAALLALGALAPAWAQNEREVRVVVKPGASALVDAVGCAKNIKPPIAEAITSKDRTYLVFNSTPDQREDRSFTADVGPRGTADKTACEESVNRQYTLTFQPAPEVSGKALQTSFAVLAAAAVLALLLESAFALLFNWRLFNALLVGRTVRTPIMFAAALTVVRQFDFDLMARLFDAYYPQATPATSTWGTSVLTAMILAGGSVGVNRILTGLGFRSPVRDAEVPKLDMTHAWVAVEVEPPKSKARAVVAVTEVTYDGVSPVRTAVGIAGNPRPKLRSLFNGDMWRVPRSGGIQVLADRYYTVTAQDLQSGITYDASGKAIPDGSKPTIFRFGPRAVLDFRIRIPD